MSFNIDYNEIGQIVVNELRNGLERQGLKNSNIYKDIRYEAGEDGLSILMPDYSIFVEKGRRAGSMPPPKPIKEWIRQKNITPQQGVSLDSLTFAISKHIAKNGIKPRPFIVSSLNNVRKQVEENIAYSIELFIATALRDKIIIK